jgi:hypothetical protein
MIKKVVKKTDLMKNNSIKEDLTYWLAKDPIERVSVVENLRRQYHGNSDRLQRVARVTQRS